MTIFEKLRIMREDTALEFRCDRFQELHTLKSDVEVTMIPRGVWEADVTFYVHQYGGVLRQDATFADGDFENLVEKVWSLHQKIHQTHPS